MRTKLSNIRRVLLWGVGCAMGISAGWAANTQRTKVIEAIVCDTLITQVADTLSGQEYAQVTDSLKREMKYEKRRERYMRRWMRLVPNQATLQYAGSIGLMSVGVGWHYGKNQHWETELLIGFVPRYHTESVHTTFTIKERYVPWHCSLNKHLTLQPLTTEADRQVITDLLDTLRANREICVGMAANMIGVNKAIIVVAAGPFQFAMVNPVITKESGEYQTEESCLSLDGARNCTRYKEIEVDYLDQNFKQENGQKI